ncbi:Zinc metalloprotease RasP [Clostridium sp. N3C]|nr:Zinc metalloprotease RasP [Clostridium sp. N3C]
MNIVYILMGLLAFSLLIIAHEFGHFIVAKLNDVKVEEFSLGMGPKIIGIKGKETEYLIKALPIGGYVKMLGEEEKTDDPRAFSNKSPLRRLSIVSAGPIMNILLAILFLAIIGYKSGVSTTQISTVLDDSPAKIAGIMVDDTIKEINGEKISTWEDLSNIINTNGDKELNIVIERDSNLITKTVKPVYDEESKSYKIGVASKVVTPSIGQSISYGFKQTISLTKLTFSAYATIFKGKAKMDDFGGPITIFRLSTKAAELGILPLLYLIAIISVQLAIFNIIPFPALDGGWILIFLLEIITRKKINEKVVSVANFVGISILMLLMVAVLLKDIFFPVQF